MAESNVNKVPTVAKVFGWIAIALSCIGIIGIVLIAIATAMPSSQGTSPLIQSKDAAKMTVFVLGMATGTLISPLGSVSGIVSLIIMLVKRNIKMIWLPITGTAVGLVALFGTILATVNLIGTLT